MTLVGTLQHTEQNRQGSGLLRTTGSSTAGGHTIDKKKKIQIVVRPIKTTKQNDERMNEE